MLQFTVHDEYIQFRLIIKYVLFIYLQFKIWWMAQQKNNLNWKISTTLIARLLTFLFLSKEVHSPSSVETVALETLIWIRLSIFRNLLYLPQCPRFIAYFIFLFLVQEICRTVGTWFAKRKIIVANKTEGQSVLEVLYELEIFLQSISLQPNKKLHAGRILSF